MRQIYRLSINSSIYLLDYINSKTYELTAANGSKRIFKTIYNGLMLNGSVHSVFN